MSSHTLATLISTSNFSKCSVTVVGFGAMGQQFVKSLKSLGISNFRVCSRSPKKLAALQNEKDIEILTGGFEAMQRRPKPDEVAVIAAPISVLIVAAKHLAALGYQNFLIEKPISLWAGEIEGLANHFENLHVKAFCAYNRVAYPALIELIDRTNKEGGITSCAYNFTEIFKEEWLTKFSSETLSRWGIANSIHVVSMVHRLIGLPAKWEGWQKDATAWHPSGAVFVGSGVTTQNIPFSYHADWGSIGKWGVEVYTKKASYRLGPLEKLFRRYSPFESWEEIPIMTYAQDIKVGISEQLAALLNPEVGKLVPLVTLHEAAALTRYCEKVFGYPSGKC